MIVYKCKICGGNLEIVENSSVCTCEHCGVRQSVPTLDDDKKAAMFERANDLLRRCEFDKAAGLFEGIAAEYVDEAEAYWGLIRCQYGIEYVEDPATGHMIPTCHRTRFESVYDDPNFKLVLTKADMKARVQYQRDANDIEELRLNIIDASSREEPYDIFICYKETDKVGNRTVDSEIAQDVYDALTEKGYRVFFSRITLKEKLGQEYEPCIFAALQSAKIMLVFGTSEENFNAVWVKNEWKRYLALIAKGEKKHLIPCIKGINPNEMPKEFRKLQALDMGQVGVMQDLLRGVEKIIYPEGKKKVVQDVSDDIAPMLERIEMYLEDCDWARANEMCEKVLNKKPKCAQAHLFQFMVKKRIPKREDIPRLCVDDVKSDNLQADNSFNWAVRLADEKFAKELRDYNQEAIYLYAERFLQSSELTIADYQNAIATYNRIADYKDCKMKIAALYRKEAEESEKKDGYLEAIAVYDALGADDEAEACRDALYRIAVDRFQDSKTIEVCDEVLVYFNGLKPYRDSREYADKVLQRKEEITNCMQELEELKNRYRDIRANKPNEQGLNAIDEARKRLSKLGGKESPIKLIIFFVLLALPFGLANSLLRDNMDTISTVSAGDVFGLLRQTLSTVGLWLGIAFLIVCFINYLFMLFIDLDGESLGAKLVALFVYVPLASGIGVLICYLLQMGVTCLVVQIGKKFGKLGCYAAFALPVAICVLIIVGYIINKCKLRKCKKDAKAVVLRYIKVAFKEIEAIDQKYPRILEITTEKETMKQIIIKNDAMKFANSFVLID